MMNNDKLDRKYAQLLLKKCLCFRNTESLLIEYMTHEHDEFVNIIIDEARKMGIGDINLCLADRDELHDYLVNTGVQDIKLNSLIDKSSWDDTAKKHGCILHINTFIPNLMNDIPKEKMVRMNQISAATFPYYRANNKYNFPWVICSYPNRRWAEFLFGKSSDSYIKLYNYIMESCMIDKVNPVLEWDNFICINNDYKRKLEDMCINKLYYKNKLGTDFEIGFPDNYSWINLDKRDNFGNSIVVNMPSYEIFTTPDYRTANGVVYNSRPLVFQGNIIDDFYIEFKDGVAVTYKAKVGDDCLRSLMESYYNSNRLGEVALVNYDSPISDTDVIFYNTLFDENASCHLALGHGNPSVLSNGVRLSREQLEDLGINVSNVHVDFMIGTSDLEIKADCKYGKKLIFKNGNFNM